jgi:hypothetical protein
MALRAQKATGNAEITVLADRGYFNGEEVLACESTGVLPCVPKTLTSGNAKRGLFTGQDFIYDAEKDHYTCPAGQHLTRGRRLAPKSWRVPQLVSRPFLVDIPNPNQAKTGIRTPLAINRAF